MTFSFFLSIYSRCGAPASWAARHTTVCLDTSFSSKFSINFRATMIENLCFVMGIEYPSDPDGSYVLTIDNMKKMLAIHMRFR